ncbi:glycine cleavage complex subunit P [Schizosaccharomyces cryophilus OY26]|uniref:Glycine cleavage system P protein n=1 Tax=Schizosaccharomyces cryophilus (strain OY26 / ATCC MYA-4695 / CBS 11777 / NBRC 106824 / NRRL Y48691) TaxID=653667 RepID=S9W2L7_SCHCR|nr:glycine cleavage complex subunit P [Schizosaccharomyces cryophilus OY26]EPY52694.1 glycine cleavage complex subunit P [Schizosaccharomyces cryophilus OY26]
MVFASSRRTISLQGLVKSIQSNRSLSLRRRSFHLTCSLNNTSRKNIVPPLDTFGRRHIGPSKKEQEYQLSTLGYKDFESFLNDVIPENVRANGNNNKHFPLINTDKSHTAPNYSESEFGELVENVANKNQLVKTLIGMGYYNVKIPPAIIRNVFENPEWYTQYTPYQAEISQGRLESMMNYQTMITDLTGLSISNASLLDEATAAGEAMVMVMGSDRKKRKTFLVDSKIYPNTLSVLRTRARGFEIDVKVVDISTEVIKANEKDAFGILVQYPGADGSIFDYSHLASTAHASNMRVVAATDLLALTLMKTPGEWGADVAVGSTQRFGLPMGFGGPHAGFFACNDEFKRKMPGRLVGLSKDRLGNPAYRLALQTREQHIRREKATSNICTAQALLANMSAFYAIYHGPEGLRQIAARIYAITNVLKCGLESAGFKILNKNHFFDTLTINVQSADALIKRALAHGYNLRKVSDTSISISMDESITNEDLSQLFNVFQISSSPEAFTEKLNSGKSVNTVDELVVSAFPKELQRQTPYLQHIVFNRYHSETELMRYIRYLQSKDLSLAHAMIPLGSCTMKLNAVSEMNPVSNPKFANIHPYAPKDQVQGYEFLINDLELMLTNLTGFDAASFQPNSGASGEYTGLSVIRAYQKSIGEDYRNICLIPVSAHGTNPASANMAGLKVVSVKCLNNGNLDLDDLKVKAEKYSDNLAAFMVTYPSTFGIFEHGVKETLSIIHENGGQVYFDGANMNAMVGLCKAGELGADVCHFNLHKTFCIPHGGGGPGAGPICVKSHLADFLPSSPVVKCGGTKSIGSVSSSPYGSASILPISWAYMRMMGLDGLRDASKAALLNANYMAARLAPYYKLVYSNENNRCAHEFILDAREFKATASIEATDIAKRLQDYSFHAPTLSWPITNTLMVEPTESESMYEMDRFCDALISIRQEIREIEEGKQPKDNNLLTNAPHPQKDLVSEEWNRPYSRERAVYPVPILSERKFWPTVARLDDAYGDKKFVLYLRSYAVKKKKSSPPPGYRLSPFSSP